MTSPPQLYSLQKLDVLHKYKPKFDGYCNDEDCTIDAVAYLSDRAALVIALVLRNHYIIFIHARTSSIDESKLVTECFRWRDADDSSCVTCATLSPSGRWLVLMLDDGNVEIIPTKMANMDIHTEYQDPGSMPLFAEDEIFRIKVGTRDDGLQIPTCALWYETKNSRRPMLICGNKGGDILFVDLLIRMMTISLEAPQSIHHLDVVEDISASDTYDTHLLVTGFATSQWLVPLEIGGQSLRETLSHVVPSELKEVATEGRMCSIAAPVHNQKTVGVLRNVPESDDQVFEVFDSLDISSPSARVKVPSNTWLVQYTKQCTVCVSAQTQVHVLLNSEYENFETEPSESGPLHEAKMLIQRFTNTQPKPRVTVTDTSKELDGSSAEPRFDSATNHELADARLLHLFPVRFARKHGELQSFMVVCDAGVCALKPKLSINDMFLHYMYPALDMTMARSLCATVECPLQVVALNAAIKVLTALQQQRDREEGTDLKQSKLPGTTGSSNNGSNNNSIVNRINITTVVQLVQAVPLSLVDLVPLFISSGHASQIMPALHTQLSALGTNTTVARGSDELRDQLSTHMFNVKFALVNEATGYPHLVAREDFRNFLLNNMWYAADVGLQQLLEARMWDCVSVLLRLHDLNDVVMRHLLQLEVWDETDDFILLATRPNFACTFTSHRQLSVMYLRRLLNHAASHWLLKRHLIMLINMTNPSRTEVYRLLNRGFDRCANGRVPPIRSPLDVTETTDPLCQIVVEVFLHSFIRHVYAPPPKSAQYYQPAVSCSMVHSAFITSYGLFVSGCVKPCLLGPNAPVDGKVTAPIRVPLPVGHSPITVSCGGQHTLVLCDTGRIYAFGLNRLGQLGVGHRDSCAEPQPVQLDDEFGRRIRVKQIASGTYHCLAITESGDLYTWGWGVYGQLGHGSRDLNDQLIPRRVQYFVDQGLTVLQIAAGHAHSLVLASDHRVYAFGCGTFGQLGCGFAAKKVTTPRMVKALEREDSALIASGQFHSLVWTKSQRLFQWGSAPQALRFKAMLNRRKREANNRAAAKANGGAANGAAGNNNNNNNTNVNNAVTRAADEAALAEESQRYLTPADVTADLSLLIKNDPIVQLSCGANHSAIVTHNGHLLTWGKSLEYQTGHGDKTERTHPTLVAGGPDPNQWRHVVCGFEHTIGVDRQGNAWCWGRNDYAQCGFSTGDSHSMAGRTITLERGNRPRGVITLPKDGRSFCQQPTKLAAVTLSSIQNELPQCVSIYESAALFDAVREWIDEYDTPTLAELAARLSQFHLAAYIYLINGQPTQALVMHAKALDDNDGFMEYKETEATLDCYKTVVPMYEDLAQRRSALAALIALRRIQPSTLERYFVAHWSIWCPCLFDLLRHDPASMFGLSATFKLQLIQSAMSDDGHNRPALAAVNGDSDLQPIDDQQFNNNDQLAYVEVDQSDLDTNNQTADVSYSFGGCGHFVSESSMQAQLARLQTLHRLNSLLPHTAASIPHIYNMDMDSDSESKTTTPATKLTAQLCPSCLGSLLTQFANQIDTIE